MSLYLIVIIGCLIWTAENVSFFGEMVFILTSWTHWFSACSHYYVIILNWLQNTWTVIIKLLCNLISCLAKHVNNPLWSIALVTANCVSTRAYVWLLTTPFQINVTCIVTSWCNVLGIGRFTVSWNSIFWSSSKIRENKVRCWGNEKGMLLISHVLCNVHVVLLTISRIVVK